MANWIIFQYRLTNSCVGKIYFTYLDLFQPAENGQNKSFGLQIQKHMSALKDPHKQHSSLPSRGSPASTSHSFPFVLTPPPPSSHLLLSMEPPLSLFGLHLYITTTAQYPARATWAGVMRWPLTAWMRHLVMRRYSPHLASLDGQNVIWSPNGRVVPFRGSVSLYVDDDLKGLQKESNRKEEESV